MCLCTLKSDFNVDCAASRRARTDMAAMFLAEVFEGGYERV
jgi:hypothetical protein